MYIPFQMLLSSSVIFSGIALLVSGNLMKKVSFARNVNQHFASNVMFYYMNRCKYVLVVNMVLNKSFRMTVFVGPGLAYYSIFALNDTWAKIDNVFQKSLQVAVF